MTKSKKIFIAIAILFLILLFYASYDIGSRTTFPGSKSQLKERIKKNYVNEDSLSNQDSIR
ncbi:hypothetical protein [Chryseosolibacter indicus]|uniref:Uncharacterized protein n=1 Tax=Chryseosolibacter indicus TaxID=2782351 RepID=A0ABS5VQD4_9BACT|nr:hypothetical protein [Chryseosolibacter indicus]MBT1703645.1 hypothetical protein [Chryseosolibacter indicus]